MMLDERCLRKKNSDGDESDGDGDGDECDGDECDGDECDGDGDGDGDGDECDGDGVKGKGGGRGGLLAMGGFRVWMKAVLWRVW